MITPGRTLEYCIESLIDCDWIDLWIDLLAIEINIANDAPWCMYDR